MNRNRGPVLDFCFVWKFAAHRIRITQRTQKMDNETKAITGHKGTLKQKKRLRSAKETAN